MPDRVAFVAVFVALVSFLCGCDGHQKAVAPASGTVMCNGKPLSSGMIVFTPIGESSADSGKPATGAVGPDGSFVLSTYEPNDGAVVGMHSVTYSPPAEPGEGEGEESEDGASMPELALPQGHPCAFGGTTAEPVEVVSGDNQFQIELSGLSASGEEFSDSGEGE